MFWIRLFMHGFIFALFFYASRKYLFCISIELYESTKKRCYHFSIADLLYLTLFCALVFRFRSQLCDLWHYRNDFTEGFSAMMEPFRIILGCQMLPKDFCFSPTVKHILLSDGMISTGTSKIPIAMASLGSGFAILCYLNFLRGGIIFLLKFLRKVIK